MAVDDLETDKTSERRLCVGSKATELWYKLPSSFEPGFKARYFGLEQLSFVVPDCVGNTLEPFCTNV